MGFFSIDKAVFLDEGLEVGKKWIPTIFFKKMFSYKGGKYKIDLKTKTNDGYLIQFKKWGLLWNTYYTIYDVGNVEPIRVYKMAGYLPQINPEFVDIQLENKVARDLNRRSESTLKNLLTGKNIAIVGIALVCAYLLFSGQWRNLFLGGG